MKSGSVYRAKYQTKWVGLILVILPLLSYLIIDHYVIKTFDFWVFWFILGVLIPLNIFTSVSRMIWKKINERNTTIKVVKAIHYHRLCITGLINEDFKTVNFIMEKCLSNYDITSPMSYYIRGAYAVGSKDLKKLTEVKDELLKVREDESVKIKG